MFPGIKIVSYRSVFTLSEQRLPCKTAAKPVQFRAPIFAPINLARALSNLLTLPEPLLENLYRLTAKIPRT